MLLMLMRFSSLFSVLFFQEKRNGVLLREPASCSPSAAWGRRLCEVQHRVSQGSLEPGLYWCVSALELLWQQLKPTAESHAALSRIRQMKMGSFLYTNISVTLIQVWCYTDISLSKRNSQPRAFTMPTASLAEMLKTVLLTWWTDTHQRLGGDLVTQVM